MSDKNPDIGYIINTAIRLRFASLRVCLPGKIEKFDPDTQLAWVKPLIPETYDNSEDDELIVEPLPVIPNVPVIFEGTDNFYLTYPIQKGDPCEIHFCDRSYDGWMAEGKDVDPEDNRRHDLTDAICIMGLRDQSKKITEFDRNRPSMGKKDGPKIAFSLAHVEIGNDWDEDLQTFAARADKVDDRLSAIQSKLDGLITAIKAHEHTTPAGPAAPSVSLDTLTPLNTLQSVNSEKVKIK